MPSALITSTSPPPEDSTLIATGGREDGKAITEDDASHNPTPVVDQPVKNNAGPDDNNDNTVKGSGEKETGQIIIDDNNENDEGYNTAPESELSDKKEEMESLSALLKMKEKLLYYPHCARCRKAQSEYPLICDGKRPCNECTRKYLKRNKLSSMEGLSLDIVPCVYKEQKYLKRRKATPAAEKETSSIATPPVKKKPRSRIGVIAAAAVNDVATTESSKSLKQPLNEKKADGSDESESDSACDEDGFELYYRPRISLETMDNVKAAVLVDTLRLFHVLTSHENFQQDLRRYCISWNQPSSTNSTTIIRPHKKINSFWSRVQNQYEDPTYDTSSPHTDAALSIHGVFEHPISLARAKLSDQATCFNSKQLMVIYETNMAAIKTAMEGFEASDEKNQSDLSGDVPAKMKVKQRYRRQKYAEDHKIDPHILYIWYLLEESDMMDLVGRTRKYPLSVPKKKETRRVRRRNSSSCCNDEEEQQHQAATLFYSTLAEKVSSFEGLLETAKTPDLKSKIKERLGFMQLHLDMAWKQMYVDVSKKRGKKRSHSPTKKKPQAKP